MRLFASCLLVPVLALTAIAAQRIDLTIDASAKGKPVDRSLLAGTCLPVWNRTGVYEEISHGMSAAGFSLFRFPNGSLSNDYHWNGTGNYTSDGLWESDSLTWTSGFMSKTRFRGTSKNNYGFEGYSAITDGDTASQWWSDNQVTGSASSFHLELSMTQVVDSVVIIWGDRRGVNFSIDFWRAMTAPYPGPHAYAQDLWQRRDSAVGNTLRVYGTSVESDLPTRFVRVVVDSALGGGGVQVKEVYLYRNDTLVSRNMPRYDGTSATQTKVTALGAHAGSTRTSESYDWDFEKFMSFVHSFGSATVPIICVNYGTGTPAEAAAWVRYANIVKKLGIRYWQVGNEMDGAWEEGGPVTAQQYGERYVEYAKAMKAVDPSIKVLGPVLSNADFHIQNSGEYDGMSWMQSFMAFVGAQEKPDGVTFLDGIDFHSYPYYASAPSLSGMMQRATYLYDRSDSLKNWIRSYLAQPDSTMVMLSEYNSSVVMSSLLQHHANGLFAATMLAGMADKFGDRAMAVFWDSFEGMSQGPDGTWGSLSLFNTLDQTRYSSFRRAPSSAYWALKAVLDQWIPRTGSAATLSITTSSTSPVKVFGLTTASSVRILCVNTSADTITVAPKWTGTAPSFTIADCYTWGEREFRWNGGDQNAYASPNCGPSSARMDAADADSIILPPLSLGVVVFSREASSDTPAWIHVGAQSVTLKKGAPLIAFGTAASLVGIRDLAYCIDEGEFVDAPSLDGVCDGPMENIVTRIDLTGISAGAHRVCLRMRDASSSVVIDTINFKVVGDLVPGVVIDDFEDGDLWNLLPVKHRWNSYAAGKNETVITLSLDSATTSGSRGKSLATVFSIVQPPAQGYDNYVSISNGMDTTFLRQNLSNLDGISFSYATTHTGSTGSFALQILTTTVKDYDEFHLDLANTSGAWSTITARWDDFQQYGWGTPAGPLDPSTIRGIEFRAVRAGTGSIKLDNVAFAVDKTALTRRGLGLRCTQESIACLTASRSGVVFNLRLRAPSRLVIYDTRGRIVHLSSPLNAATTEYSWHPHGASAPSGAYFASLYGSSITTSSKFILTR